MVFLRNDIDGIIGRRRRRHLFGLLAGVMKVMMMMLLVVIATLVVLSSTRVVVVVRAAVVEKSNDNNNNNNNNNNNATLFTTTRVQCAHANAKGRRASNEDETLCAEVVQKKKKKKKDRLDGDDDENENDDVDDEKEEARRTTYAVAGVFDGHDGAHVSRQARRRVAGQIARRLESRAPEEEEENGVNEKNKDDEGEREEAKERWALEMALRDVHESIEKDKSNEKKDRNGTANIGGSTALVTLIAPDFSRATFAWVGDSRAYACESTRNEAKIITRDHTVIASVEEAERVRKSGGVVTGNRAEGILVTRALGDFESRGVGGARAETRTVRLEEFAEKWEEKEEGERGEEMSGSGSSSNPRKYAEEVRRRRRGNGDGEKEKDLLSSSSTSSSSSSSSKKTRNKKNRKRRRIRGIVLISDGVIEKAEDDKGSERFMNELCEIFFGDVKTVDVKRRIKRRRFQLETTTIALKPVSNPKNAAKESKKIRKEVTPEDDDAFIRSEHVIENDLLNSDLVELKVDGDVELEPDENVLPIEAWADIRSFGENVDMAKNARLTCEMAIAMGSKDNVAVAAIRLPDVVEELEKNDSDNRNNIAGDEEEKDDSYASNELPRTESETGANRLTIAEQRRNDGRFFSIDPKPGAVFANIFRLNEIVALSNGPIKNYQHGVLHDNESDERGKHVGSNIAPAQKYVAGGEGYPSYSAAIEIPWNVDLYEYGDYFDFDGTYFSSASGALPEANSRGEVQKQMTKLTDADKAFAMLMIAPASLHEHRRRAEVKVQTPSPAEVLSRWWLYAKSGISSALFSTKRLKEDKAERELKEDVILVPPTTSAQHEDAPRSNPKRVFAKGHFGEVWRATAFDVGTLTPQCRTSAKDESLENDMNDFEEENGASSLFVIKRIFVERGDDVRRSGSREMYFGNLFCDVTPNVARFHRAFETTTTSSSDLSSSSPSPEEKELWLAFRDEGTSLDRLMYEDQGGILRPSKWWIEQRKIADENGKMIKGTILHAGGNESSGISRDKNASTASISFSKRDSLREILLEIARGVSKVHQANVAHRDIKPANVFVAFESDEEASSSSSSTVAAPVKPQGNVSDVRIGDFGSAVDAESFDTLFGPLGPNSDQETPDFAPPESLFRVKNQHPEHHTLSSFDISKYKMYDAWSLGIVFLEVLALGTSRVWDDNGFATIGDASKRERFRRHESLRDASSETRLAYNRIRAMLSLCIAPSYANFGVNGGIDSDGRDDATNPSPSEEESEDEKENNDIRGNGGVYSGACLEENIMRRIKLRDPLHLGLPNAWALRLIRRLLQWTPDRRLDVSRIEKHAFFKEQIDEVTGESFFANEGWTCPNDASGFVYEFSDECAERCNTVQCV